MRAAAQGLAFVGLMVAGCASVIGIQDRSLRFCLQPAHKHDFCEDFDQANPSADWSAAPVPPPGTSRTYVPTDHAPPNALALDTIVGPLATGDSNFTGLQQLFGRPFNRVVLGADVRIDQFGFKVDGSIATGAGFLLLSSASNGAGQPSLCIGLALAPGSNPDSVQIVMELVPDSQDCVTVDETQTDSASPTANPADDSGTGAPNPAGAPATMHTISPVALVFLKQWFHLTLDVQRQGDGSGVVSFDVSNGTAFPAPQIPPGTLGGGYPALGIATDVTGPSDTVEVLFDNVTVDFPASVAD